MSYRRLFVLALLAGLPGIASAQFTTFIPPKPAVVDSVKAVVAAATQAKADTALNVRITNMKTWVDSAAGVSAVPMTAADSLATAPITDSTTVVATTTTTMANGTRAPATASALPLIALLGGVMLGAGLLLFASPRLASKRAPRA